MEVYCSHWNSKRFLDYDTHLYHPWLALHKNNAVNDQINNLLNFWTKAKTNEENEQKYRGNVGKEWYGSQIVRTIK